MPASAVTPNQSALFEALRAFLLAVLPAGTDVQQSQANRVAEPIGPNFVLMTPIRRERLATNLDGYRDATFTGSIDGETMTIEAVHEGVLAVGLTMFGTGVLAGTTITAFGTGVGGVGTYIVAPEQAVAEQTLSAGTVIVLEEAMVTMQLDVHGPASGDNAQVISALFRDPYAVDFFAGRGDAISPLHADEPRQLPFVNESQQVENRWVVEAHLQVNASVSLPQQFADAVDVDIINVDATYPPS